MNDENELKGSSSTSQSSEQNLNLLKMTDNLKKETSEEQNLLKILEILTSEEKCLEKHICSIMKKNEN
jgi:hypothetical protein